MLVECGSLWSPTKGRRRRVDGYGDVVVADQAWVLGKDRSTHKPEPKDNSLTNGLLSCQTTGKRNEGASFKYRYDTTGSEHKTRSQLRQQELKWCVTMLLKLL